MIKRSRGKGKKKVQEFDRAKEFMMAIDDLAKEKGIAPEVLFDAIEAALISAYRRNFGSEQNAHVQIDRETGEFHVYAHKTVVKDLTDPVTAMALSGRSSDIVTGTVQRVENRTVFIDLGRTEAVLTASEQIEGENYVYGDRVKAYILEVRRTSKGPQVSVSRTHPGLLKRLFELEVPEIYDGIVEIKSVAREPGMRSKIAVYSKDADVDPVGSCVGHKGMRVQAVVTELRNEKIDIVKWNEDPAHYIANALSPAKVVSVAVNEGEKASKVVVPDNQLSLAIGKEGQNARLAAKLTGWKIDIKSESQAAEEEPDESMSVVEVTGEESFSVEGDEV